MSAVILDGKALADKILDSLKPGIKKLKAEKKIIPKLAVILVGNNSASLSYINSKTKLCQKMGINYEVFYLPEKAAESKVLEKINELNDDFKTHGIIVQLPLPKHLNVSNIITHVYFLKDVDGFHPFNLGKLILGDPLYMPCTPFGIMSILAEYKVPVEGKHAVIIGRSVIVGKPLSVMLLARNATVTVCHSKTPDLAKYTKQADILVAAVGKPKMITSSMIKKGACIIDVGINKINKKLTGDVDFESVKKIAGYITPVPGGVGAVTSAMLIRNTVQSAFLNSLKK